MVAHPEQARFGNTNALRNGARSPNEIKRRARNHRRRFLRQLHTRATDMDPIALAYVDGWARALAKLDAYDDDPQYRDRDPREYHAALNSARLWLAKLEQRLGAVGVDRGRSLDSALAAIREGMPT
jgi:hypothetical protein